MLIETFSCQVKNEVHQCCSQVIYLSKKPSLSCYLKVLIVTLCFILLINIINFNERIALLKPLISLIFNNTGFQGGY